MPVRRAASSAAFSSSLSTYTPVRRASISRATSASSSWSSSGQVGILFRTSFVVWLMLANIAYGPIRRSVSASGRYLHRMLRPGHPSHNFDADHRVSGEITDPQLHMANNPYSVALATQRWLSVVAKPELREGELERLYISD